MMRRGLFVILLTSVGCASTPAPAPTPVATVTVDDPPLPPIKIVDAPPPTIAEPPPQTNPLLEQLTADSENLRELGRSIAKHQQTPVKLEAAQRLLVVGRTINSQTWAADKDAVFRDTRAMQAYDAMAEIGGESLADFLLEEAETATYAVARRRVAAMNAESAFPGDANRAARRLKVASELAKLSAKEPLVADGTGEAALVTGRLAPGFRRCYERELESNPTLEVSFKLNLTVDPRGAVTQSKADATPAKELARCIEVVGKSALFAPIAKNSTVIVVPIAFNPNRVRTL